MRVLWISNIIFPELCNKIGMKPPVVGGWMQAGAKALLEKDKDLSLGVVSFYNGNSMQIFRDMQIQYYLLPEHVSTSKIYDSKVECCLKQAYEDFQPNIVHIHGSEYGHSFAQIKACGNKNTIVSIQGLVSIYKDYYYGGIKEREIRNNITFRDIVRNDSLPKQQKRMAKRGELEIKLIKGVNHVIGRTTWDESCTWAINPKAKYHFCNETLRDIFYVNTWKYEKCSRHRIFLSQGQYPIKGMHQVVKALPLVLREFPDTEVFVAGNDFYTNVPFYKQNGYANYILSLLKKYGVAEKIHFLGPLSEKEMAEQYIMANVFVCPSAIENSPNSVGEAQLLGTPVIASLVGGTMDMIKDAETGFLYRFEEIPLLANRICKLFEDENLCNRLSLNAKSVAIKRHNKDINAQTLLNIYNEMIR